MIESTPHGQCTWRKFASYIYIYADTEILSARLLIILSMAR
jgi:hypothetical protein